MKKVPATNTQEKILEAAKKVFHRKGFDGARMQEIADEAVINKALLHYYYGNKEALFQAVFEDAFTGMISGIFGIFTREVSFDEKVKLLLDFYLSFLSENSYVPWFILNCLHEKPEQLGDMFRRKKIHPRQVIEKINSQVKKEYNLEFDAVHFYVNLISLCIFPVVAKPLIREVFGLSEEEMDRFNESRKTEVPLFILNALKGYEPKRPKKRITK